jgi:glycosidase
MNYHAFAFPAKGFLVDGRLSAHDFGRELQLRREQYPVRAQFALQNLVDSHDTDRLASMIVNRPVDEPYLQADRFDYDVGPRVSPRHDPTYSVRRPDATERRIQRLVVLLQMTYVGAPMVYYGDEAGMWGGDDPCDRWPMVWEDLEYEPQAADPLKRDRQADEVAFDGELFDFYRRAIALRRASDVLRYGGCRVAASDDAAQFFAFSRTRDGETALVAFNRGEEEYRWKLPADAPVKLEVALTTDEAGGVEIAGARRSIVIPGLTGVVLTSP